MTDKHPLEIYGTAVTAPLYSPCQLHIDPMERLLLINFENDPDEIYKGFEPQIFADPVHGQGMLVIGWRVDGRVDVYHQPGLTLDPKTYDIAGAGLAEMVARPFTNAYFEVNETGVDATFAFVDVGGRPVEVTIREQNRRKRKPFGLLAPMGSAATAPSALPLVYLHDFYFVRRADTAVSIMVAGEMRQPDVLPLPLDGTRMYFTRYSPEPLIATLNPAHNGPLLPLELISAGKAQAGDLLFDLVDNHGWTEIAHMRRVYKEREVTIAFKPSLPNLAGLTDGVQTGGCFAITADPTVGTVSGTYQVERQAGRVQMTMTPGNGWQPNEDKWMLRFLYRAAPIFREWPKTYRWTAVLDLTDPQQATMHSAWQRMI